MTIGKTRPTLRPIITGYFTDSFITYIANSISHHENNNINQNEIVRFFNVNSPCSKHITEYKELLTCDISYAGKRTSAQILKIFIDLGTRNHLT